jgi:hypothetical protein
MVVPRATVRVAGENELALITTVFAGIVDGAEVVPLGLAESLLHPNVPTVARPTSMTAVTAIVLFMTDLLDDLFVCICIRSILLSGSVPEAFT